jgi:hypothetical protein
MQDLHQQKKYIVIECCKYTEKTINEFQYNCEFQADSKYMELFESYNCVQGHTEIILQKGKVIGQAILN